MKRQAWITALKEWHAELVAADMTQADYSDIRWRSAEGQEILRLRSVASAIGENMTDREKYPPEDGDIPLVL